MFYDGFFIDGWNFFYRMCISIVESLEDKLCDYNDPGDFYIGLKLGRRDENVSYEEFKKLWENIINKAYLIDI